MIFFSFHSLCSATRVCNMCNGMSRPLCTRSTGALVVKAVGLGYGPYPLWIGCYGPEYVGWQFPTNRSCPGCDVNHIIPNFWVDGAWSVMSPQMSYSGGIKAVAPPSQGVLLGLCVTKNISTLVATSASL